VRLIMSLNPKLHKLLIAKQSLEELERKRDKAYRKSIWNQEDFDFSERAATIMHLKLVGILTKQTQTRR